MAQVVGKYAAKKILGSQLKKYQNKEPSGPYDPLYAYVDHPTKRGKKKKVKKQIPDYLPEHDAIILAKMRKRSYALDMSLFNLFGIRFGWSSVVGMIPAAGDAIDMVLALLLVYRCSKVECGLGTYTMLRMLLNVFADFVVGLVPFIGDLVDAAYKVNTRNVRLLEQRLDQVYKPKRVKEQERIAEEQGTPRPPPATVYEDFSDDEERLPRYRNDMQEIGVTRPQAARVSPERRGGPARDERRSGRQGSKSGRHPSRDRR